VLKHNLFLAYVHFSVGPWKSVFVGVAPLFDVDLDSSRTDDALCRTSHNDSVAVETVQKYRQPAANDLIGWRGERHYYGLGAKSAISDCLVCSCGQYFEFRDVLYNTVG